MPCLETNRLANRNSARYLSPEWQFSGAEKICIGEVDFTTQSSGSQQASYINNFNNTLLFSRFINAGWYPSGLDTHNTEYMYLTEITLATECGVIPDVDIHAPITVSKHPTHRMGVVEMPIKLTIGADYDEKIFFPDKETGKEFWVQINKVYLLDIWEETRKSLGEIKKTGQFTDEQLSEHQARMETFNHEICPRGMYFLAIDYECEGDITLNFYSAHWLESPPHRGNSASVMMFANTDEQKGKLGTTLKTAVIQEPFSPDITELDAEIYSYNESMLRNAVVI